MENQKYLQEGLDMKRILLLLIKKLWLLVIITAGGAAAGAVIYLTAQMISASEREYQSVSKIYLDFACEPEDYSQLAYNGYTWNDLMRTDPILNVTMEALPAEISREEAAAATKAEILSDIRLLTITITTDTPEKTNQIMSATQAALVHLGETDTLFHGIEIYSTTEPKLMVWDNRMMNAVQTGVLLALFAGLLGMLFYYVLDDSVYVQADLEQRYWLPVIGTFMRKGSVLSYEKEFYANYSFICGRDKKIAVLSVDKEADARKAKLMMEEIFAKEKYETAYENLAMEMPESDTGVYEKIRQTDGVLLTVRYGSKNGKRIERMLSNLKKQECEVLGFLLTESDAEFLKSYYFGRKKDTQ